MGVTEHLVVSGDGAARHQVGHGIEDVLLASQDGLEVRFTGQQRNQDDHDLLMTLVFMAQYKPLGAWVTVPASAILTALGRQTDGLQYRELRAVISRLAAGMVSMRNAKAKIECIGHYLIAQATQAEGSRHWLYQLDPELRSLYGDMSHTLIDGQKRRALQGKDVARWLQLSIASHAQPFPVKWDPERTQRQPRETVEEFPSPASQGAR
jgi:hypothetical protein